MPADTQPPAATRQLEVLRREAELERSELAELAGCSYRFIYGLETGIDRAREIPLRKIARALSAVLRRPVDWSGLLDAAKPEPDPKPAQERRAPTTHPEPERPYPPPRPPGPRRDQVVSA